MLSWSGFAYYRACLSAITLGHRPHELPCGTMFNLDQICSVDAARVSKSSFVNRNGDKASGKQRSVLLLCLPIMQQPRRGKRFEQVGPSDHAAPRENSRTCEMERSGCVREKQDRLGSVSAHVETWISAVMDLGSR